MAGRDEVVRIPDPPKPRDNWSSAYLVQSPRITDLYARNIEKMIEERGGFLFAGDGSPERAKVMGVWIDERA